MDKINGICFIRSGDPELQAIYHSCTIPLAGDLEQAKWLVPPPIGCAKFSAIQWDSAIDRPMEGQGPSCAAATVKRLIAPLNYPIPLPSTSTW